MPDAASRLGMAVRELLLGMADALTGGVMTSNKQSKETIFGALIQTDDGSWTIKHASHGQDFHSLEGAKFEAWELYVIASGFMQRLAERSGTKIAVLDVGMGLGYNAAATMAAWYEADQPPSLHIVSLEIDERLVEAIAGGSAPWCDNWGEEWLIGPKSLRRISDSSWQAQFIHPSGYSSLVWCIYVGDASLEEIPLVDSGYEFIWQDPFTPELNPQMWSKGWFTKVRLVSAATVQLMTYSVSRVVRDALTDGGWQVQRFPTPGRKRHWLKAAVPMDRSLPPDRGLV